MLEPDVVFLVIFRSPLLYAGTPRGATPVTIVVGRHDRVVPPVNAEYLDDRLPTSRVVLLDAGHFVWEEAPTAYASIILDGLRAAAHDTARTTSASAGGSAQPDRMGPVDP